MARFLSARVAEAVEALWAALQAGEFIADAAVRAGTCRKQGTRWVAACGGVRPRRGRDLRGRCLSFAEREEIALARARGETMRAIARRLGRSSSTISRELRRNADRSGYEGVRPSVCEAEATGLMCQSGSRSPKWILRAVSAGVQERADLHFVSALSMAR
jgi:transposase-like protein